MSEKISRDEKIKAEIKILLERKFFDLKSGQVIINKNNGVIQDIKFIITPYKRGQPLDSNTGDNL